MPRFNNRNKKNERFNQRVQISNKEDEEIEIVEGIVVDSLPNTHFRIMLKDNTTTIGYLSGKMRVNKIKILVGDKILLQLDEYGGKPRIIRRF